jgi:hypothetical protein
MGRLAGTSASCDPLGVSTAHYLSASGQRGRECVDQGGNNLWRRAVSCHTMKVRRMSNLSDYSPNVGERVRAP